MKTKVKVIVCFLLFACVIGLGIHFIYNSKQEKPIEFTEEEMTFLYKMAYFKQVADILAKEIDTVEKGFDTGVIPIEETNRFLTDILEQYKVLNTELYEAKTSLIGKQVEAKILKDKK
jgi:hypothetical protein